MEQTIVRGKWRESLSDLNKMIVVYSPTTLKKLGLYEKLNKVTYVSSHVAFDDLEDSIPSGQSFTKVVGIGGGTAIDKAKYLANELGLKCIAIPSMLSTNVFATNKIAYINKEGKKMTIDGVLPDMVIYDESLIEPDSVYSIYGLADALSSLIALKDWEIADYDGVEPIDKECYADSAIMLAKAKNLIKHHDFDRKKIFGVLLESGYVTNKYGSGRPESGSEHIIAKSLEQLTQLPHAVAVCFGMLVSSQYHNCFDEVVELIKGIGIFEEIEDISPALLKLALVDIQPRPDRYTILDVLTRDNFFIESVNQTIRRIYDAFDINEGAVIFDLDGVLWDAVDEIQKVYEETLDVDKATLESLMGKSAEEFATALNITVDDLSAIQEKEVAHLMTNPGRIYPYVIEVIRRLKESGRKLFIVSNCQKGYINTFLENYGLSEYFEEWRHSYPNTENSKVLNISYLVCRYNLLNPVYIGDTQSDFDSAEKAGVKFIAADYGFGTVDEKATVRIKDITELPHELEKRV